MTDYTEQEVRMAANTFGSRDIYKMLSQFADMLAEREKAEPVYQRRHVDSHTWVDCSLEEYKIWHENNRRILYTHPAAQPRVPDVDMLKRVVADGIRLQLENYGDGMATHIALSDWRKNAENVLAAQESGR